MKAETKFNITLCVLGAILIALVWLFLIQSANAAGYAIVSFESPEHLAALQDSVVGVRDTVGGYYYNPDCPGDTVWFDITPNILAWLPNCEGMKSLYDSTYQVNWRYVDKIITCRRLVGVTIETHPKSGKYSAEYQAVRVWDMPGDGSSSEKWETYYAKLDSVERENVIPGEAIIFYEPYKEEQ